MSNSKKKKVHRAKIDGKKLFIRITAIVLCVLTLLGALVGVIQFL